MVHILLHLLSPRFTYIYICTYSIYICIQKSPHEIAIAAMNEVVLSRQPKESGSASERGSTPPWPSFQKGRPHVSTL